MVDNIAPVFRKLTVVWSTSKEWCDLEVIVSGESATNASDGEGEFWVFCGVIDKLVNEYADFPEFEDIEVLVFGGDGVGTTLGSVSDASDSSVEVDGIFSGPCSVNAFEIGAKDEYGVGVFHEGFHAEFFGVVVDGEGFHGLEFFGEFDDLAGGSFGALVVGEPREFIII